MDKNPKKGLKKFFEHLIYKSSKSLMKHLTRYKMLGKGCVFSVVETVREAAKVFLGKGVLIIYSKLYAEG